MRVPSPAARTMARRGAVWAADAVNKIPRCESDRLQCRNMPAIPLIERRQRRMRERTLQIGPYPRHVSQILRLAVADIQAGEYAEDLARTLRRQRDVVPDERSGVELGVIGAAAAKIAAEQGDLELLRHVDTRVLQQRGQVVGRRPHQGILEIEEPYPLELAALRQPEQVRRMDVAQDPGGSRIDRRLQRLAPERLERRARFLGDRRAKPGQVPVNEQLGFDQERADVV